MKRVDFENGTITSNILGAALPMLVAQILSLLYNIVDRIYIARIPNVGTAALGGVGLCFPVIVIITAFSNLFGSGGAPLFSIERGKNEPQEAKKIMNTSFSMVCICAVVLPCRKTNSRNRKMKIGWIYVFFSVIWWPSKFLNTNSLFKSFIFNQKILRIIILPHIQACNHQ